MYICIYIYICCIHSYDLMWLCATSKRDAARRSFFAPCQRVWEGVGRKVQTGSPPLPIPSSCGFPIRNKFP